VFCSVAVFCLLFVLESLLVLQCVLQFMLRSVCCSVCCSVYHVYQKSNIAVFCVVSEVCRTKSDKYASSIKLAAILINTSASTVAPQIEADMYIYIHTNIHIVQILFATQVFAFILRCLWHTTHMNESCHTYE